MRVCFLYLCVLDSMVAMLVSALTSALDSMLAMLDSTFTVDCYSHLCHCPKCKIFLSVDVSRPSVPVYGADRSRCVHWLQKCVACQLVVSTLWPSAHCSISNCMLQHGNFLFYRMLCTLVQVDLGPCPCASSIHHNYCILTWSGQPDPSPLMGQRSSSGPLYH